VPHDPATRGTWQRDPAARRAIDTLWRHDPDPVGTLTIQSEIDAVLAAGAIGPAKAGCWWVPSTPHPRSTTAIRTPAATADVRVL
jgi:hypothetical protein